MWNMVFVGIPANLPGGTWPDTPNTFVNPTPLSREKPFLFLNGSSYAVYVPALRTNTNGITWSGGQTPGTAISIDQFTPYDPPNQDAWRSAAGVNGWASYKVASSVTSHEAWGLGVYSVFTNPNVFLSRAVEVPNTPNVRFHHLTTVNLTANGGISQVINDRGGATAPGIAVNTPRVTDYP
ncbi:MAG TPA: hypothetical protein VFK02_04155 [Kofleriaceae bacterium]|nr:hypothetical protein [Kofleriaceae bacterium]